MFDIKIQICILEYQRTSLKCIFLKKKMALKTLKNLTIRIKRRLTIPLKCSLYYT